MKNKYLVCMMAFLGLGLADLFYLNSQIIPSFWPTETSVTDDSSGQRSETTDFTAAQTKPYQEPASSYAPETSDDIQQDSAVSDEAELTAATENQKSSEDGIEKQGVTKAESDQQAPFPRKAETSAGVMESAPPTLSSNPYADTTGRSSEADRQTPGSSLLARVVVRFESGEFRLASKQIRKLQSKLTELDLSDKTSVTIDGYTDHTGAGKVDNELLSQQRADYVAAILIQAGVLKDQITAAGHGDSNPIDLNHSKEAWAKNRRVEIKIFKDKS